MRARATRHPVLFEAEAAAESFTHLPRSDFPFLVHFAAAGFSAQGTAAHAVLWLYEKTVTNAVAAPDVKGNR